MWRWETGGGGGTSKTSTMVALVPHVSSSMEDAV
jgi:hypothetical protein